MDTRDFSPEIAKTMQAAFERVCRSLGLGVPDHFPTEIIPAKITHFANAGVHDADEFSRIMPVAGGGFDQCYNAQAVVATESLLVIAAEVVFGNIAGTVSTFGDPGETTR
jgi:hypothetical protein